MSPTDPDFNNDVEKAIFRKRVEESNSNEVKYPAWSLLQQTNSSLWNKKRTYGPLGYGLLYSGKY